MSGLSQATCSQRVFNDGITLAWRIVFPPAIPHSSESALVLDDFASCACRIRDGSRTLRGLFGLID